ncbi:hypothetical protein [Brachybacterium sp. ACRRE]|uniref:hypothetical protein n=1 Tax=Brachybacterium sp. ACRRE TaxID=2918184 RepID=UPI001EF1672A|nr:hypothetical protein [Brachybacterium sp. ACRRE]MCG7308567.1 hypothetical protein [Brachybacterium sp. ACRRE]
MAVLAASPATSPRVLYRARSAGWVVALYVLLVACMLLIAVAVNVHGVHLTGSLVPLSLVVGVGLVGVPSILFGLGLRQSFTVTSKGLVIVGTLRTRRIPWERVRIVEVDRSFMTRGATMVVLNDGRRIRVPLTAARFALWRGESPLDHGRDLLAPARPVRAAIDAHRTFIASALQHDAKLRDVQPDQASHARGRDAHS